MGACFHGNFFAISAGKIWWYQEIALSLHHYCVTFKFEIMENNIQKEDLLALVKSKIYVTLEIPLKSEDVEDSTRSRSQIATLNRGRGSNIKYLPYAFTELGVAMLSSVLKSVNQ